MDPTFYPAEISARGAVLLAHGAGAGQQHPFMTAMARGLARRGLHVMTFDFPYVSAGRRAPDPPAVLEQAAADAHGALRARAEVGDLSVIVGGKSMGGRIASQAAARGLLPGVKGLFFLGYPLHQPGRAAQTRDKHLTGVPMPMLFVQGARDTFGTPDELAPVLDRLGARAELMVIPGGDHSFKTPKSEGSQTEIHDRILEALSTWFDRIRRGSI
jgi:predicted alpha/beta-hydrolase family hydrolase